MESSAAFERARSAALTVTFFVETVREPGILARVLAPFARRDIEIDRLVCERHGESLTITAQVHELSEPAARQVAGNIRQMVGVVDLEVASGVRAVAVVAPTDQSRLCA